MGLNAVNWTEISVETPPVVAELVADTLIEAGCHGVMYRPDGVTGYLPAGHAVPEAALRTTIERAGAAGLATAPGTIQTRTLQEEDWAHGWKIYFKPLPVAPFVIVPSWEAYSAKPGEIRIDLDPGMAFGTGHHGTTALCLDGLAQVPVARRVLDVGTGSGILAIAAAKLGWPEVIGCDNDELAVMVARDNVRRNEVPVDLRVGSVDVLPGDADLVVANILAEVISELADSLAGLMKPGGTLLASGIIREREQLVRDALEAAGLRIEGVRYRDEWVLVEARK